MEEMPPVEKVTESGDIELDRLHAARTPAQVLWSGGATSLAEGDTRAPHRHDYHELFLVEAGSTTHSIDGAGLQVDAGGALLIGRGQVHVLERSEGFVGAVVRFGEELLGATASEVTPGWVLASCDAGALSPPPGELAHALALARVLGDELRRPPDAVTDRIVAACLDSLLALTQRWRAAERLGAGSASGTDADGTLLRRFGRLLEAEYQRHHDAGWYASQLHVSANHLAAVLTRMTGRSTKRLITDRVMVEAQRLLRYTDLTVQQVAQRLGFDDPLYLSRAFKAHVGESPTHWREIHTSGKT